MEKEEKLIKWFNREENCKYYNKEISKQVGKKLINRKWNMTKSIGFWILIILIGLSIISSIALGYPVDVDGNTLSNIGSLITVRLSLDDESIDYLIEKIKEVRNE